MTSPAAASSRRIACASVLLALACQHDGEALFDNNGSGAGGSATGSPGGSASSAGETGAAAASTGGSAAEGGEGGSGAKTGGSAGTGTDEGGTSGTAAGTAGQGGEGGSNSNGGSGGTSGHAGSKPDPTPEPVTITITEFEDAHVVSCDASDTHGSAATINIDADMQECVYQGLIRPLLDPIPDGALVSKATLSLYCVNSGSPIQTSYVEQAWKESTVTWNNRPGVGTSVGQVACEDVGLVTVDVTAAVQTWVSGEAAFGLYLIGDDTNGIDFASSEAEDADTRPLLSVTYVMPLK